MATPLKQQNDNYQPSSRLNTPSSNLNRPINEPATVYKVNESRASQAEIDRLNEDQSNAVLAFIIIALVIAGGLAYAYYYKAHNPNASQPVTTESTAGNNTAPANPVTGTPAATDTGTNDNTPATPAGSANDNMNTGSTSGAGTPPANSGTGTTTNSGY